MVAAFATFIAIPALAQTYNIAALTANRPHFGVVAGQPGTATTSITINPAGTAVTSTSPSSGVVVNGTGRITQTISITCSRPCSGTTRAITIVAGAGTNRMGTISDMVLAAGTGTIISQSFSGGTLSATVGGWTANNQARTWTLGMTVPIAGDGTTTATSGTSAYTVNASNSRAGTAAVTVLRGMTSIVKNSDLSFGSVQVFITPPATSSTGTVTMPTGSNTPTTTGSVRLFTDIARTRAQFTVTGQAGAAIGYSLSSSSINLVNGANTIPLTLTLSATTGTISGTALANASGTATVFVGGTMNLDSSTVGGTYSGSFTLTATYN